MFFEPLSLNMPGSAQKMALGVLIFSEGFAKPGHVRKKLIGMH